MEDPEKYKRPDGMIDWAKYAIAQLSSINDNLSLKKKTKALEELPVYKIADALSDKIWKMVNKWDWFAKKTIGEQMVRSADSVGANIAEGYGRYFFGEYVVFLYYAADRFMRQNSGWKRPIGGCCLVIIYTKS